MQWISRSVAVFLSRRLGDQALDLWRLPSPTHALVGYTLRDPSGWSILGALGELHMRSRGPQESPALPQPAPEQLA